MMAVQMTTLEALMMFRDLKILIVLVAIMPFLRLIEGVFRMMFMSDYYGSFWNALMSDIIFSDGWLIQDDC